jgi:tRNA pseudouridine38-40 synthase
MRYFIFFSYNGAAYHGWQYQPNASSVQEEMERAMQTILRLPDDQRVILTAAGRTDTGVHARLMAAHFDLSDLQIYKFTNLPRLCRSYEALPNKEISDLENRLNGFLPADISVHRIVPVRPEAHARFDALSRTYEYWVTDIKNPFTDGLITYTRFQLDYDLMNEAAKILLEEKDFASFCKAHSDNKTTLCDIRRAFWEPRPLPFLSYGNLFTNSSFTNLQIEKPCWVFTIEADRFLRNMVRAVVGTLFEVGRGAMTIDEMRAAIHAHDRCAAGQSMPPDGLYLTDIRYPDSIFL